MLNNRDKCIVQPHLTTFFGHPVDCLLFPWDGLLANREESSHSTGKGSAVNGTIFRTRDHGPALADA